MIGPRTHAPILHEPTDELDDAPTPVPPALYDILACTLGATVEGPADNEVVHFNGWSYSKAAS